MIVGVAILKDGIVYALPRPARHCHLFAEYNDAQRVTAGTHPPEKIAGWQLQWSGWPAEVMQGGMQGFTDMRGRFVGRAEAAADAYEAGQISEPKDELFSEDIW